MDVSAKLLGSSPCRIHRLRPSCFYHLARSRASSQLILSRGGGISGTLAASSLAGRATSGDFGRPSQSRLCRVAAVPPNEEGRRHLIDLPRGGRNRGTFPFHLQPQGREEWAGAHFLPPLFCAATSIRRVGCIPRRQHWVAGTLTFAPLSRRGRPVLTDMTSMTSFGTRWPARFRPPASFALQAKNGRHRFEEF